jgi:methionyl-tRNA formyltransferase
MKIVFMGNPEFAVISLKRLIPSKHEIIAVVTNPPKRAGRGRSLKETSVSIAAKNAQLPVVEIDDLNSEKSFELLQRLDADVYVVVAYRILPERIISIPRLGAINLHGSLLPKYRGAAPIQWALINGETDTGLTTFIIEPKIDTGKILLQQTVGIEEYDDYGSLAEKMSCVGADLLVQTLDQFENGEIKPFPQKKDGASLAPKITSIFTVINWQKSAFELHNLVRGLSPFPGAQSTLNGKQIKLYKTQVIEHNSDYEPGIVSAIESNKIYIQTLSGQLVVHEVQLEGKKRMSVSDFLRGYSLEIGIKLG